jgi:anti-anti-sigma factor
MDDLHERREAGGIEPPRAYTLADGPSAPGVAVVVREGELDLAAAPELRARVDEVPAGDALVLDLARTTFVDSAMLRELLRTRDRPLRLVLAGPPPQLSRLLALTHTADLFECVPDVQAALTRLTG